ncbi:MAG: hypothetical protein Q8R67_12255 [Rhodoferax sp.]|nr:hypothetical protein [Rhodoferax sp.]MDP3652445.1 hypothetical protein [Rhodoferax sp.]
MPLTLLAFGVAVMWWLMRKPSPVKSKTFEEPKPRIDHGPRLAELRAKIKLKAEGVQVQTTTVDGIATTKRTGPAVSIPIAIKVHSGTTPIEVGHLTLQTSLIFERDEIFADLNRRATDAKAQKDWSTAIELLRQAKARQGDEYQEPRLALFLQQAGRFDEAMVEIEWLLARISSQCDAQFPNASTLLQQYSIASRHASIHEKARLICHREKRHEMAASHQILHDQFQKKADALGRRMDRERQKKHEALQSMAPRTVQ